MIAQVQIEAASSPIMTSFTTHPACQNSAQMESSPPGAARVVASMFLSVPVQPALDRVKAGRHASSTSFRTDPRCAEAGLFRAKFGERKAFRAPTFPPSFMDRQG